MAMKKRVFIRMERQREGYMLKGPCTWDEEGRFGAAQENCDGSPPLSGVQVAGLEHPPCNKGGTAGSFFPSLFGGERGFFQ